MEIVRIGGAIVLAAAYLVASILIYSAAQGL